MFTFIPHSHSRRKQSRRRTRSSRRVKLLEILLCVSMLICSFPLVTAANQEGEVFNRIAELREKETEESEEKEAGEDPTETEEETEEGKDPAETEETTEKGEDPAETEEETEEGKDPAETEEETEEEEDPAEAGEEPAETEEEEEPAETEEETEEEEEPVETEEEIEEGEDILEIEKEKLYGILDSAADEGERFADIVEFESITLHYPDESGQSAGELIQDNALLEKNKPFFLYYKYEIPEDKIQEIMPETRYYLEVSPHLILSSMENGSPLMSGEQQFGKIFSDRSRAWVTFDENEDGTGTVLSDYDGLTDAYFYLNCRRAGVPPEDEPTVEGEDNLYAMKFENGDELLFGYAENQLVEAKAKIEKGGKLEDKKITWTIDYTPWQNPGENDQVAMDTPFELRDRIDSDLHRYVDGSIEINGSSVLAYDSRSQVPEGTESYAIVEEDGKDTVLIIGGTKFNAVAATKGNPAQEMEITYETELNDKLLLPGGKDGQKVANEAWLFAGTEDGFKELDISSRKTITIAQPAWLKKEGKTTRHTDGTGSTTDWTITFWPNGFTFTEDHQLTLHDQLPGGSTLTGELVNVNGEEKKVSVGADGAFRVSPIITDMQPVTIAYQTSVPEEMYNSGTDLGDNTAWFTFLYEDEEYRTPKATTPVGSGNGTGTSGTAILEKSNSGYDKANRTIKWTVTINPHKAYLREGIFTDDLSAAFKSCNIAGHAAGLELAGDVNNITVLVDGKLPEEAEKNKVELSYHDQILTIKAGEMGPKTITLEYETKVCDPCIFANNTVKKAFTNTISTDNMVIGKQSTEKRKASADSTSVVNTAVLDKKAPVYDYASGTMKWTVEVNEAGLPMADVVLKDNLPAGLTYIDGSFAAKPEIPDAEVKTSGQEMLIDLGSVHEKTTITFTTKVDPEQIGFNSNEAAKVTNVISMTGKADNMEFMEVSHQVEHSFTNHGLVKSSMVDNSKEWIQYEVLINPFGLSLPENPSLEDTLDKRLQLDRDTLRFYEAEVSGIADAGNQKPVYKKKDSGQQLEISGYDPAANSFTVQLPIKNDSRGAYVLAYTADIIQKESGGYGNSVRFDGGSVLLGGSKSNNAVVGGGGGGGGGGVAARKAGITITKRDSQNQEALEGVTFTLYQWDSKNNMQGLPYAQGVTDAQGRLSFKVKPGAVYELVETGSLSGYGSALGWEGLPPGVTKTERGLLVTAGEAKSELSFELTNEANTTDIIFLLFNQSGIPMAGQKVNLFLSNPDEETNPIPNAEAVVSADGTVRFSGLRGGRVYFIRQPGGETMMIEVPLDMNELPKATLPDGTQILLSPDDPLTGVMEPEQQWDLTVVKTTDGEAEPLAGAVFGLYADNTCQTLIKTGISGQDGTIIFPGLIKGQKYWLREIEAPSGYNQDFNVYETDEAVPVMTISNTPKTSPEGPQEPDNPGNSGGLGDPGSSDDSGSSGGSGNSGDAGSSGSFGNSEGSGGSGSSGIFENPGDMGQPADQAPSAGPDITASIRSIPAPSDHIGENGMPEDIQETKAAVHSNNQSGRIAGDSAAPKTGDNTPGLIAVVLLSGILLMLMTLGYFLQEKNNEKR